MLTHTPSSTAPVPPAEKKSTTVGRGFRRLVVVFLVLSTVFAMSYAAVSIYIATQIMVVQRVPIYATPASLGL